MKNSQLLLAIFALLALTSTVFGSNSVRDVCVLGGGAAGASTAAFLKDNGYDVVVLERQSTLGGHCNTYYFTPPQCESVDWLDYGVQLIINTTQLTSQGIGNWVINTQEFVERFAGPESTMPLVSPELLAYVNMETGELAIPNVNQTALQIALQTYYGVLYTYPWVNDGLYTGKVPVELLGPFGDFASQLGLEPLAEILRAFGYNSGVAFGNYTNIPTVYMLNAASATNLQVYFGGETGCFRVRNGCNAVYQGIHDYLGTENVVTGAQITSVVRPRFGFKPVEVRGYTTNNGQQETFLHKCKKVVVAFPPIRDNLEFMDLGLVESAVFDHVKYNYYYAGIANVSGAFDQKSFQVMNADPASKFNVPFGDSAISVGRYIEYGPAQVQALATTQRSVSEMRNVIQQDFDNIPDYILNNVTLGTTFQHGGYSPYFATESLLWPVSPYFFLDILQGTRDTYWHSALNRYSANSAHVWDGSRRLVDKYFPDKNN
ncbi:putative amine oxidase [Powai lake megavirus]|uniref:Putative amine oxidase n=1 Tax=Powai lake megavirus TaxID=1842663 RepID=A0A167RMQ5_9VIRU|nr:putative amine oxidase [Powai lake megavirus]ANB50886.1 putative amine oxidase [Powai lake megavirus]